jgi:hypothetical protein
VTPPMRSCASNDAMADVGTILIVW